MTNVKSIEKYCSLEERLKMVEGFNAFGVDALDICLVLEWLFPPKFKEPLAMFCRKMVACACNKKLMIYYFQDKLSGGIHGLVYATGSSPYSNVEGPC